MGKVTGKRPPQSIHCIHVILFGSDQQRSVDGSNGQAGDNPGPEILSASDVECFEHAIFLCVRCIATRQWDVGRDFLDLSLHQVGLPEKFAAFLHPLYLNGIEKALSF